MANIWHKHPFRLLLHLEWILLGIALLTAFSWIIPHPRHHGESYPAWFSMLGFACIVILGLLGLRLPSNSKLIQQVYIFGGFILSWLTVLLIASGERVFPVLLLVVSMRACLLFSWGGRIFVAILAYISFLVLQTMSFMRISFLGIPLGRPLPPVFRRLPPEELRGVWFGLAFNSALLFAFVLAFVLLLVSAVLAEHKSRARLIKAHRRLRDYALQIEDRATLQERNRIAREIHDSVGHYLTAQSIQLENTVLFLTKDLEKAGSHLEKARQLGKEALIDIRSSVATLRKNPVERSLKITIEQIIAQFQANTNIAVSFKTNLMTTLPLKIGTALYRIVQEALTNITKHSQATQVELLLYESEKKIVLTITDNGCGFNPQENTTGFGLQGMQERTEALQGNFKVTSKLDRGCQIKLEIPLSVVDF